MNTVSKVNSIITVEYLHNQKENQYFERKGIGEKETKPTKLADELIGMLNADGGILVFGVSDDGKIQNLNDLGDELNKYRTLVFDFIQPACSIELEEITIEGNLIFLFHVEQDIERIFCRKDTEKVLLRVLDTNRELNRDQIKKLEYDKGIRRFEEETVKGFENADLDADLLNEYKEKLNFKGDVLDLIVKRYLARQKNSEIEFKNAAVLLFAKDPEKYIPSASVRYIRYEGITALTGAEHNVTKDQRFQNNIPKLIDEVRTFLRASFKDYHFLDMQTGRFKKVPEYPEEAWLEGVVNALCHRSYNVQGNSIYIKHFDDRLEISNSGPLPAQVTVENIKSERFARNPRLARALEDMAYVRQLNEGVNRIYESMEKSMLSLPEYHQQHGNVYLTLRNKISTHSKAIHSAVIEKVEKNWLNYNDSQRKILEYLFFNHSAVLAGLATSIGINEKSVRTYLNEFVTDEILERISQKQRDINAVFIFRKH